MKRIKYFPLHIFLAVTVVVFVLLKVAERRPPNVILIMSETLRTDHLGCYGYDRDTSRNLDGLAEKSVFFRGAISSAPSTDPSVWNIISSRYKAKTPAPDDYVIIPEDFKRRGYRTAAFISHHYLDNGKGNLDQGFDMYDSECEKSHHMMSDRRAQSVTTAAIEWLKAYGDKPFFVWLFYFDPHDPYIAPGEAKGYYNKTDKFSGDRRSERIHSKNRPNLPEDHRRFLINAYDEEIRYLDREIGRFLDYLKTARSYHNSIIVFTADHGEELGDNGGRWDHCQLLSQEEIRVPLIVKMPGQRWGRVVEEPVQTIDLYPTLVNYLDGNNLPDYYPDFEGKNLLPLMKTFGAKEKSYACCFWQHQKAIFLGNHKYWYNERGFEEEMEKEEEKLPRKEKSREEEAEIEQVKNSGLSELEELEEELEEGLEEGEEIEQVEKEKKKEILLDLKTGKEIDDPVLLNDMKEKLNLIYEGHVEKAGSYEETIEHLRSIGYLQ